MKTQARGPASRAAQHNWNRTAAGLATRTAVFAPKSWNAEDRTIDLVWSTGADVQRYNWWTDESWTERLSMDPAHVRTGRLNSGGPFLKNHDAYDVESQIGVIVDGSARIDDQGLGVCTVRLSDRASVVGLCNDIANGIIRNISVGYSVHAEHVTRSEGGGEIRTAVDWEPHELSAVAVPADAGAQTRDLPRQGTPMPARSKPAARITPAHTRAEDEEKPVADGEEKPAGDEDEDKPADGEQTADADEAARALVRQGAEAERKRAQAIQTTVRKLGLPQAEADALIASGRVFGQQERDMLIDKAAASAKPDQVRSQSRVSVQSDHRDQVREGMANALAYRANPRRKVLTDARDFRSELKARQVSEAGRAFMRMSLVGMARACLDQEGVDHRDWSDARVFSHCLRAQSTSDFPLILADVTDKSLMASYAEEDPGYEAFCAKSSFKNLQTRYPTIVSGVATLTPVAQGAPYGLSTLSESRESYNYVKYGTMVEITLELLMKDDMGAFDRLPAALAGAARRAEAEAVFGLVEANGNMADGFALFSADHDNLIASSAGVPTAARLDAMDQLLALQTGLKGEKLALKGKYVVLPRGLMFTMEQLFQVNGYLPTAATGAMTSHLLQYQRIYTPFFTSTAKYYLFADPGVAPVIEYAFAEGEEGIVLEEEDGFANDTKKFKVREFFGVGKVDFRGAVMTPGA